MVTAAKAPVKIKAKPAAKRAAVAPVNTARSTAPSRESPLAPAAEPSLRFYHSKALQKKTHRVLARLEAQPDHPQQGDAIADLVSELIEAGMDYYFLKALKQAEIGFIAEQSARLGMSGAVKIISSVSRKFITRMDQAQLLVVGRHIRSLAVTA